MKRRNFEPIGSVITQFLKENQIDTRLNETRAIQVWRDLMGSGVANYTREIYVRNGVLYVHLSSAVLRHELSLSRSNMILRINEQLGQEVLVDILFR